MPRQQVLQVNLENLINDSILAEIRRPRWRWVPTTATNGDGSTRNITVGLDLAASPTQDYDAASAEPNESRIEHISTAENLATIESRPDVLQLDLDTPESVARFKEVRGIAEQIFPFEEVVKTTSRSGNTHVYIRLKQGLSQEERILLQACLGSDPKRELLSYKQVRAGEGKPLVLFETKAEAEKVQHLKPIGA